MASTAAPNGLTPVDSLSSSGSYSGSRRPIPIASGYATSIFAGDVVMMTTTGTLVKETATTALTPIGIFMGCEYTDPNSDQKIQTNMWTASVVASDAVAFVADDPFLVFRAQGDGAMVQAELNNNVDLIQTAGSTVNGRSKIALDASSADVGATLGVRIIGFVDGPDSAVGDAFTDCYCTWTPLTHLYLTALGTGATT